MNLAVNFSENFYNYKLKGLIHSTGYRTQTEFGEAIGVSTGVISRLLRGYQPDSDSLRKIADGLGLSMRQLRELL